MTNKGHPMSDETVSRPKYIPPVEGRSCGSCTMCCKLFEVPVLAKPANKWCTHCAPGQGCGIWQTRPEFCQDYHCWYMTEAQLGEEWRPDKSKFIVNYRPEQNRFVVNVDASAPGAWRQEPYFSTLKRLSGELLDRQTYMQIIAGKNLIYLTPENETVIDRPADPTTQVDLQLMVTLLPNGTSKRWFEAKVKV